MAVDPGTTSSPSRNAGVSVAPVSFFIVRMCGPGISEMRSWGTCFRSSAHRAFSLKWEPGNWKSSIAEASSAHDAPLSGMV